MHFKLPPSLTICLGTCMAAAILAFQNADEYCEHFENEYPHLAGLAEGIKYAAYHTGLPQLFHQEKRTIASLAKHLPMMDAPQKTAPFSEPIPEKIRIVYIKVPTPAQLNNLRRPQKRQENTILTDEFLSVTTPILADEPPASQQEPAPQPTPPQPQQEPAPQPTPLQPDINQNEAAENSKTPIHYRIMMLGDSLMEDLGPTTHRTLRHRKGLHFILTAKYSTGLSRPDYFNWPENMKKAVSSTQPDLIVFFMGANDGMPIKVNGKTIHPNSGEAWKKAYKDKMQELFAIGRQHGCDMIWLGLPPMGSKYAKILAQTAQAQKEGCAEHGIQFVDTTPILGDASGNFRSYLTDSKGNTVRLRAKDKEHLAPHGNKLVVDHLVPLLEKKISDFRKKHPERCLNNVESARSGRATLDITIKYSPR